MCKRNPYEDTIIISSANAPLLRHDKPASDTCGTCFISFAINQQYICPKKQYRLFIVNSHKFHDHPLQYSCTQKQTGAAPECLNKNEYVLPSSKHPSSLMQKTRRLAGFLHYFLHYVYVSHALPCQKKLYARHIGDKTVKTISNKDKNCQAAAFDWRTAVWTEMEDYCGAHKIR